MSTFPLNPYQVLFFNREISFGNSKCNILKGNALITGADLEKLRNSIHVVLEKSQWPYLSINKDNITWQINKTWNGSFELHSFEPEISLNGHLWAIQLIENDDSIQLFVFLHHCLADAHSFNIFWENVIDQYNNSNFKTENVFPEISYNPPPKFKVSKILNTELGIGKIRRISTKFNKRQVNHLNNFSKKRDTTLFALLLQYFDNEINICEKELQLPLKIGIALRNRRNYNQKNAFPTFVNFLPLPEDNSLSMLQKITKTFRYQDYPLTNYLRDFNQSIAFNILFSFQKETYKQSDDFKASFTFESSTNDDNILGIHLLEFDDESLTLHLDYRLDIASETYWKSVIRNLTKKIISDIIQIDKPEILKKESVLYPKTKNYDFWSDFDNAAPNKIALICNNQKISFDELREKIKLIKFNEEQNLHYLNTNRTSENIIELIAAWRNDVAVTYHEGINLDSNNKKNKIAYVAKTSGTSSVVQKTIQITFESLSSLIPDWKKIYKTKNSIHISLADQRFDVFFGDILRSIISGETLVLANENERLDATKITELIKKYGVSHFESTPSFLTYLLPSINNIKSINTIICGSEPIQKGFYDLISQDKFKGINFFNSYGLTECSIDSAVSTLFSNPEGYFPSGYPIGDQKISIRNNSLEIIPMGLWGEICIEGKCLDLAFQKNNINGIFKTGDLGMITSDGLIVKGRLNSDFIKINGRRIPATYIEHLVSSIESIENCLCIEVENSVVLFVFGNSEKTLIAQILSNSISRYQQPDTIYFCKKWPINQNGKVDQKKLKEFYFESRENKKSWTYDENCKEEKIIFECLTSKNKKFGDTFESLISFGWNSIELLSLANELNLKGVFVPISSFIQNPTIDFIINSKSIKPNEISKDDPKEDNYDIDDILSILND